MARPKSLDSVARRKLIDAAEKLFSESGFDGVSTRAIAEAAGVNVALIGYYFGGKGKLFAEAFRRSAVPINDERLAMLAKVKRRRGRPQLQDIVLAWLLPVFRYDADRTQRHLFIRLGTLLTDRKTKFFEQLEAEIHHAVNEQFIDVLAECLPNVTREVLLWRLYFLIAATAIATRTDIPGARRAAKGKEGEVAGIYRNLQPLVDFAEGGFRAPERSPLLAASALSAPRRSRTSRGKSLRS
jgi:AcrR family transcriptional regulator